MPHTHSRYMQDLGFTDGLISFDAVEFEGISVSGTAPSIVRNAVGDVAWQLVASSQANFDLNLLGVALRRSGFFEDTQNVFGSGFGGGLGGPSGNVPGTPGTGVPTSAEPQGRPGSSSLVDGFILPGQPQPASGMGTLQQITPRTGLKIKGFKPLGLNVIYKVLTGAATTLTCSLTMSTFRNNQAVATGQTNLLAVGANGLVNVAQAAPYVTAIPIPNAVFYQITPLTQLWFEINVTEPAANSFQLYGVELACEFNYN